MPLQQGCGVLILFLCSIHCSFAFVLHTPSGTAAVGHDTPTLRDCAARAQFLASRTHSHTRRCRGGGRIATNMLTSSESEILDFQNMDPGEFASRWVILDDAVMGGASSSRVVPSDHGGTLQGMVTTKFNGGFCSARCVLDGAQDLSAFEGIAVRVMCEKGMRYKLILRENTGRGGVAWCASFDTNAGQWTEVKVPFSSLIPTLRGSTVPTILPFDSSSLAAIQLMLSKFEYNGELNPTFQEGEFALKFGAFRAYKGS